jgi:hypothetical protein
MSAPSTFTAMPYASRNTCKKWVKCGCLYARAERSTMLISHKHKFIFIHIYKNAGTSINEALFPYAFFNQLHKSIYKASRQLDMRIPAVLDPQPMAGHVSAAQVAAEMGVEKFRSYFSFAIVRNPWDWQVSLYTFPQKQKRHRQHELISSFKNFDEYIRWRCAEAVRYQKDFVYDENGNRLVDFIGHYESLQQDFDTICESIGIQAQLPRLNVSKSKPYQDYYTPETKELVSRTFAADIELFGYEFE